MENLDVETYVNVFELMHLSKLARLDAHNGTASKWIENEQYISETHMDYPEEQVSHQSGITTAPKEKK